MRLLKSQFRHRRDRAFLLGLGIVVAAVSFVMLASSTRTSEVRVRGAVRANFRSAYDILVRPVGSATPLERTAGLVRDNYLSGIFGGITLKQYARIRKVPGVAVAAPIANIGVVMPFQSIVINLDGFLDREPFQLYRLHANWSAQNGLSTYPGGDTYVYVTRRDRFVMGGPYRGLQEVLPNGSQVPVCYGVTRSAPQATAPFQLPVTLLCYSTRSKARYGYPGFVGSNFATYFPMVISAIDPVEENKLLGLKGTLVGGRYLREGEAARISDGQRFVPVLASNRTFVEDKLDVRIQRLTLPTGVDVPQMLAAGACVVGQVPCPAGDAIPLPEHAPYKSSYAFLRALVGPTVGKRSYTAASVYDKLLGGVFSKGRVDFDSFWTGSPVSYRVDGDEVLHPLPVSNPDSTWISNLTGTGYYVGPPDNLDLQFRRLTEHAGNNAFANHVLNTPRLRVVGRFDPDRLPGFSPLSRVPLETYYPPTLLPGNAATARALGGKPLLPNENVGGYIAQPPLLLTTLQGLKPFLNRRDFPDVPAQELRAPISVIRIKVKNVTGPNALSETRIRLVAEQIHDKTGLQVDITAGSSPHQLRVALPKGKFGRPRLVLLEGWVKKGVSVSFLRALDRKDLSLFALILVVCAFFLSNGSLAAVKGRRSELGTLQTLGWSRSELFRSVLGELAAVGLAAGLAGTGIAAALVVGLNLSFPLSETLYVLPIAVALATLAGLLPAWRASRGSPLDAIRPRVAAGRRSVRVRGARSLALVNLVRLPGRTLVALSGLALGVAALTFLVGIERAFQGTLVGTLLGNAVAIQIRGADIAAIALTVGLAALSVADVLYLNLRERRGELVTLKTLGWSEGELRGLVAREAFLLGLAGSLAGALAGLALSAGLLHVPLNALVVAAGIALAGGTGATLAASLLPLSQIQRLAVATVLAEE